MSHIRRFTSVSEKGFLLEINHVYIILYFCKGTSRSEQSGESKPKSTYECAILRMRCHALAFWSVIYTFRIQYLVLRRGSEEVQIVQGPCKKCVEKKIMN